VKGSLEQWPRRVHRASEYRYFRSVKSMLFLLSLLP